MQEQPISGNQPTRNKKQEKEAPRTTKLITDKTLREHSNKKIECKEIHSNTTSSSRRHTRHLENSHPTMEISIRVLITKSI